MTIKSIVLCSALAMITSTVFVSASASDRFSTEADGRQHRNIDTLVSDRVAPVMPTTLQATGGTATSSVTSAKDQAENATQTVNKAAEKLEQQMSAELAQIRAELSQQDDAAIDKTVKYGHTRDHDARRATWVACTTYTLNGNVLSKSMKELGGMDYTFAWTRDIPDKYKHWFKSGC